MARRADAGSILPLAIGLMAIALALITLAVVITDIYMAHRKLFALADSAALAAADAYTPGSGGRPSVTFTDAVIDEAAEKYIDKHCADRRWASVGVRGSAEGDNHITVELTGAYRPVLLGLFIPRGMTLTASVTVEGALLRP